MVLRLIEGPKGQLVIFDYGVLLLATIFNLLALVGTLKGRFVLKNYRRYLVSLVASNLLLCAINASTFANQALPLYGLAPDFQLQTCLATFQRSALLFGIFANLFTLFGMSVEHYVGIMYPLRYGMIIEKPILRNSMALIWGGSLLLAFGDILISSLVFGMLRPFGNGAKTGEESAGSNCQLENSTFQMTAAVQPIAFVSSFSAVEQLNDNQRLQIVAPDIVGEVSTPFTLIENLLSSTSRSNSENFEVQNFLIRSLVTKPSESNIFNCFEKKTAVEPVKPDWCTFILENKIWQEGLVTVLTVGCFCFLTFFYGRIIKHMVRKNRRIFREWIITTVLLLGTFIICWLPFMLLEFIAVLIAYRVNKYGSSVNFHQSKRLINVHNVFHSIFLCFPLLDPILHVTRVSAVRKYFKTWPCCFDKNEVVKTLSSNGNSMKISQRNNCGSWRFKNGEFIIVKDQLETTSSNNTSKKSGGDISNRRRNNVFRVVSDVTMDDSLGLMSPTGALSPQSSSEPFSANKVEIRTRAEETKRTAIAALRGVALIAGGSAAQSATSAATASEWYDDPEKIMLANDIYHTSAAVISGLEEEDDDNEKPGEIPPQYVSVV